MISCQPCSVPRGWMNETPSVVAHTVAAKLESAASIESIYVATRAVISCSMERPGITGTSEHRIWVCGLGCNALQDDSVTAHSGHLEDSRRSVRTDIWRVADFRQGAFGY